MKFYKKLLGIAEVSPTVRVFTFGEICKWLKQADCKSALIEFAGSNPALTTIFKGRPLGRSFFGVESRMKGQRWFDEGNAVSGEGARFSASPKD